MFNNNQQWRYKTKSYDAGLCDCAVGNTYTLFSDAFNEVAFLDDSGMMVCINGREDEFMKHFELVDEDRNAVSNSIFQQVSKELYVVDADAHNEFSIGSKISQRMLDYYLSLHPNDTKVNVLTKVANN